ncbi:MAG TPA: methyltransferase domain-containing protein [Sphingomicrobium sp.]|nr:methyltransferase domain-containing protein [Sphingomicrobium sp.]
MNAAAPFDSLASVYDCSFSDSEIGRHMRAATWRRMDAAFQPGQHVLELNCGTGEDALHLARRGIQVAATDQSEEMLNVARAKIGRAGLTGRVTFHRLAIEELPDLEGGEFDGVLSNFGGLNCVEDVRSAAERLASILRPGARALLCVMGPVVPWEWGWFLAGGQPRKAVRRLRRGGVRWRGLTVRYPSIRAIRRAFAPHFVQRRVSALGVLLPPTYVDAPWARHPAVLRALDRFERRIETFGPLPWLADHFLIELERVGPDARGAR